jgi:RecB family exonuclease
MTERLTNSRISSFKKCRKLHWFEYEIGLRKVRDSKALRMGSAFHDALDVLKKGGALEDGVAIVRDTYDATEPPGELYDWVMERETIVALVVGNLWRWGDDRLEIIESEFEFNLPLVNPATGRKTPNFTLAGKIDGIIRLEDGRLAVLEHKTTSEDFHEGTPYHRRLFLDSQLTTYVYAARRMGFDVSTCLYDVTRKPLLKPTPVPLLDEDGLKVILDKDGNRVKNKNGSWRQVQSIDDGMILRSRPMMPEEWSDKVLGDVSERHHFYFGRIEIPRLDSDIDEYVAEIWDVQRTIAEAKNSGRWFKTVSRDTCVYCPYFDLCLSKWSPSDPIPEGFHILEDPHPELGVANAASPSCTESACEISVVVEGAAGCGASEAEEGQIE